MKKSGKTTFSPPSDTLSDEAIEWLVQLHSGVATDTDREQFRAWRQTSSAHERAASEAEALWDDLLLVPDQSPATEPGPSTPRDGFFFRPSPAVYRTIGCVALTTLFFVVLMSLQRGGLLLDGWFADYRTATGEQRAVTLSDGSVMHLNSRTALSVDFSETRRRLILHYGQALFSVAPDGTRPFEVVAAGGRIRALGTRFEVSHSYEEVTVTVIKHEVEVTLEQHPGQTLEEPAVIVTRGKRVRYGPVRGFSKREDADLVTALAWRRGKLIFKLRPLGEVIAEVNRYRTGWITIFDSQVVALQVSGVFELADTDAVLRMIENTLPVQVISLPYVTLLY